MTVDKSIFDKENNITQFTLSNSSGDLVVKILDYGAIITNIFLKTGDGEVKDVVLGFDSLDGYKSPENAYFGAVVGRVANRIAKGSFHLNDQTYQLALNTKDGRNHLHGGVIGFDQKIWRTLATSDDSVTLEYTSIDGEEGYPGEVTVSITYTVTESNEVKLQYTGRLKDGETRDTILNLTNHTYFNLSGADSEEASKILDHRMIFSEPAEQNIVAILPLNEEMIPTGQVVTLSSKAGAAYDFYQGDRGEIYAIGDRIEAAKGYDIAFIFPDPKSDKVRPDVLRVWSPQTNICLTMSTSEPAVQFYTGESLSENLVSKEDQGKVKLGKRSAFCLEANRYADAINHEDWRQQVILKPGQDYRQTTIYKFHSYPSGPKGEPVRE